MHIRPDSNVTFAIIAYAMLTMTCLGPPIAIIWGHVKSAIDSMNGKIAIIDVGDDAELRVAPTAMPKTDTNRPAREAGDSVHLAIGKRAANRLRELIEGERIYRVYFNPIVRRAAAVEECDERGCLVIPPHETGG